MAEGGNNRERKRLRVKQRGGVEGVDDQWKRKGPGQWRVVGNGS